MKYPRTPHLPTSPGATGDDVFTDAAALAGRQVVVTEKMDGECTTLLRDGMHARSVDSRPHPSQDWVRALHGRIAHDIPRGMRVCGESLFARHSLGYTGLESYFLVFSVWSGPYCLPWEETLTWAGLLGLAVVPQLYTGPMPSLAWLEGRWRAELGPQVSEGFVVRDAGGFDRTDFRSRVAKWVRPGHVGTDTHWRAGPVVPNGLRG